MRWAIQATLATIVFAAAGSGASGQIVVSAQVGFGSALASDRPGFATLQLAGTSEESGPADLNLIVHTGSEESLYSTHVVLHHGVLDEARTVYFRLSPNGSAPQFTAELRSGARLVARRDIAGIESLPSGNHCLLVVDPERSGVTSNDPGKVVPVDWETQFWRSGYPVNRTSQPSNAATIYGPLRPVFADPSQLPTDQSGYAGIRSLLLSRLAPGALSVLQWGAISRWVNCGGNLIVCGGADLVTNLAAPPLNKLLPVTPVSIRLARTLPEISARYNRPAPTAPVPMTVSTLKPAALLIAAESNVPVIAMSRSGLGTVTFSALDLTSPSVRGWAAHRDLWMDIYAHVNTTVAATERLLNEFDQPLSNWQWNAAPPAQIESALAGPQGTRKPALSDIAIYMLAYIVCLVPVNYLLLKRLGRRELAWITSMAVVLLFTVGAYGLGLKIRGNTLYLRSITLLQGSANSPLFTAATVAGVFAPFRGSVDLVSPSPSAIFTAPIIGPVGSSSDLSPVRVSYGAGSVLTGLPVEMWRLKTVTVLSNVDLGGTVAAYTTPIANRRVVVVYNGTRYMLSSATIQFGTHNIGLGDVGPACSAKAVIPSESTHQPAKALPVASPQGWPQDLIDLAMPLRDEAGHADSTDQYRGPVTIDGWINSPVDGLQLASSNGTREGVTFVRVVLPETAPAREEPRANGPPPGRTHSDPFAPQAGYVQRSRQQ